MRVSIVAYALALLAPAVTRAIPFPGLQFPVSIDRISGTPAKGPSKSTLTSQGWGLDAPKIHPLNGTAFDWWYFDAVASDLSVALVAIAFTTTPAGLWDYMPDTGSATWIGAWFTWADGTSKYYIFPAPEMVVTTVEDGSSGTLKGVNAGWTGKPDNSKYVVNFDEKKAGIQGSFTLKSRAPAHLPCTADVHKKGATYEMSPGFGWANAVPDGDAVVDFLLDGEQKVHFTGPGYHDKNWGARPANVTAKGWSWGHARTGPYSLVWFTSTAPDGSLHTSAYASSLSTGRVLASSCAPSQLSVKPVTNPNSTVNQPEGLPDGFDISLAIPGQGTLSVQVQNAALTQLLPGIAARWMGNVTAGFKGNKKQWTGVAFYEYFTF